MNDLLAIKGYVFADGTQQETSSGNCQYYDNITKNYGISLVEINPDLEYVDHLTGKGYRLKPTFRSYQSRQNLVFSATTLITCFDQLRGGGGGITSVIPSEYEQLNGFSLFPLVGNPDTTYLDKLTGILYYWDSTANQYHTFNSPINLVPRNNIKIDSTTGQTQINDEYNVYSIVHKDTIFANEANVHYFVEEYSGGVANINLEPIADFIQNCQLNKTAQYNQEIIITNKSLTNSCNLVAHIDDRIGNQPTFSLQPQQTFSLRYYKDSSYFNWVVVGKGSPTPSIARVPYGGNSSTPGFDRIIDSGVNFDFTLASLMNIPYLDASGRADTTYYIDAPLPNSNQKTWKPAPIGTFQNSPLFINQVITNNKLYPVLLTVHLGAILRCFVNTASAGSRYELANYLILDMGKPNASGQQAVSTGQTVYGTIALGVNTAMSMDVNLTSTVYLAPNQSTTITAFAAGANFAGGANTNSHQVQPLTSYYTMQMFKI